MPGASDARILSVPFRCHHPRRRMTQYSRTRREPNRLWLLDHPPEPVLGLAEGETRGRLMTTERRRPGKRWICASSRCAVEVAAILSGEQKAGHAPCARGCLALRAGKIAQ